MEIAPEYRAMLRYIWGCRKGHNYFFEGEL